MGTACHRGASVLMVCRSGGCGGSGLSGTGPQAQKCVGCTPTTTFGYLCMARMSVGTGPGVLLPTLYLQVRCERRAVGAEVALGYSRAPLHGQCVCGYRPVEPVEHYC